MNKNKVPAEWIQGIITLIYKKGEHRKYEKLQRNMYITSNGKSNGKISGNKLENDIKEKIEKKQVGFTSGPSCLYHIRIIQRLLEKTK